MKRRIAIVGAGNVGWNLATAFHRQGHEVVQVISRTADNARALAAGVNAVWSTDPAQLNASAEIIFLTLPDRLVGEVAAQLPDHGQAMIVHTSGSLPMDVLSRFGERRGVFYPLQTFTKAHQADFENIPIFIEGTGQTQQKLLELGKALSQEVRVLPTAARQKLHVGAVFACNFPNMMWLIAGELIGEVEGLDFGIYRPLVEETMKKAFEYSPEAVQTGPAKRGDNFTLDLHGQILDDFREEYAELYEKISRVIREHFGGGA